MKKTFTIIILLSTTLLGFGQNLKLDSESNVFLYSTVISFDGKTEAQLFNSITEWSSSNISNFNRKNLEKTDTFVDRKDLATLDAAYRIDTPLKLSDKEGGKIIDAVIVKYNGSQLGTIRTLYINYDIKIIVKDGKIKFEALNFVYNHFNNASGKPMQIWGWKDEGDCASKGTFEALAKCEKADKAFEKIIVWFDEDITKLKDGLVKFIKSSKNEKDF